MAILAGSYFARGIGYIMATSTIISSTEVIVVRHWLLPDGTKWNCACAYTRT